MDLGLMLLRVFRGISLNKNLDVGKAIISVTYFPTQGGTVFTSGVFCIV